MARRSKRTLGKNTLALTSKFDCDRFLRLRLATPEETQGIEIEGRTLRSYVEASKARPGVELVQRAGRRYEIDRYEDLVAVASADDVAFLRGDFDAELDRTPFDEVSLFEELRRASPPRFIVEGAFGVPATISPALEEATRRQNLDRPTSRPDVIWVLPASEVPETDRLGPAERPEYVLVVVDVKMAADPNLRHFVEVAYYGLALAEALHEDPELAQRYAVHRQGYVWPGTHDHNAFRNLAREAASWDSDDPVSHALRETLKPIPHEVYHAHVLDFFESRLLPVLDEPPLGTSWHVAPKCQLCENLLFCQAQAQDDDHLSRLAGLTEGQADALRQSGIDTTAALADAVASQSYAWQTATERNPQLGAEGPSLLARAEALRMDDPVAVDGRRTAAMPRYYDMGVFLTFHFDPGSGIAFAMGAKRVYFEPGSESGTPPHVEDVALIVDRLDPKDPASSERARLAELIGIVNGWLQEADRFNETLRAERRQRNERDSDYRKVRVHFFFWDRLEVTQLRRMVERHAAAGDPAFNDELAALSRLFPPDGQLPDPDAFLSQPGTVVKGVVGRLVGMPQPHGLTLMETANALHPILEARGASEFEHRLRYGFETELSDQLPFERAYELWEDRVYLRPYGTPKGGRPYRRDQIRQGLEVAVERRLSALADVVRALRTGYGDRLLMQKSPFSLAERPPIARASVEPLGQRLAALHLVDETSQRLENYEQLAFPVEEREAKFIALRGLEPTSGSRYDAVIAEARRAEARYRDGVLLPFTFSVRSRDAKVREGDFTLALSNEADLHHLHVPWRRALGLNWTDARAALVAHHAGLDDRWRVDAALGDLLQVELVRLVATETPPFLVLRTSEPEMFAFAQARGLIQLDEPLVVDRTYKDFRTKQVKAALAAIYNVQP